jgi:hypothetical protein
LELKKQQPSQFPPTTKQADVPWWLKRFQPGISLLDLLAKEAHRG